MELLEQRAARPSHAHVASNCSLLLTSRWCRNVLQLLGATKFLVDLDGTQSEWLLAFPDFWWQQINSCLQDGRDQQYQTRPRGQAVNHEPTYSIDIQLETIAYLYIFIKPPNISLDKPALEIATKQWHASPWQVPRRWWRPRHRVPVCRVGLKSTKPSKPQGWFTHNGPPGRGATPWHPRPQRPMNLQVRKVQWHVFFQYKLNQMVKSKGMMFFFKYEVFQTMNQNLIPKKYQATAQPCHASGWLSDLLAWQDLAIFRPGKSWNSEHHNPAHFNYLQKSLYIHKSMYNEYMIARTETTIVWWWCWANISINHLNFTKKTHHDIDIQGSRAQRLPPSPKRCPNSCLKASVKHRIGLRFSTAEAQPREELHWNENVTTLRVPDIKAQTNVRQNFAHAQHINTSINVSWNTSHPNKNRIKCTNPQVSHLAFWWLRSGLHLTTSPYLWSIVACVAIRCPYIASSTQNKPRSKSKSSSKSQKDQHPSNKWNEIDTNQINFAILHQHMTYLFWFAILSSGALGFAFSKVTLDLATGPLAFALALALAMRNTLSVQSHSCEKSWHTYKTLNWLVVLQCLKLIERYSLSVWLVGQPSPVWDCTTGGMLVLLLAKILPFQFPYPRPVDHTRCHGLRPLRRSNSRRQMHSVAPKVQVWNWSPWRGRGATSQFLPRAIESQIFQGSGNEVLNDL